MNFEFKEICARITWVDLVVTAALLRGIYVGARSGFFNEVLRLLTYVVTIAVTLRLYKVIGEYITLNSFLNEGVASAIGFVALAVCVFLLMKILVALLKKMLKVGEGGFISRTAGAITGAVRWGLLLGCLFYAIDLLPAKPMQKDIHERSLSGPVVCQIMPTFMDFLSSLSPQLSVPTK